MPQDCGCNATRFGDEAPQDLSIILGVQFNDVFRSTRIDQCLKQNTYTHDEVLLIAETTYHEFLEGDKYTTTRSDISMFKLSEVDCLNCGEKGHMSHYCKKPSHSRQGGCRRGGLGGGHSGQGRHSGGQGCRKSGPGRKPKKIQPKAGDLYTKHIDGFLHHWYGKCNHWNKTHMTAMHG